ncbi:hypothetical protein PISL3812_04008 [Talaromyces islandicus]|uniref:Uncharacterized protein n=1 Tax=Talaromyces islandicus TaxID=28573 RepID=A0A0U1LUU9_TALIS|nr:hypothetical protein PISL3812_04008 [Talaromyces islandicus]
MVPSIALEHSVSALPLGKATVPLKDAIPSGLIWELLKEFPALELTDILKYDRLSPAIQKLADNLTAVPYQPVFSNIAKEHGIELVDGDRGPRRM